MSSARGRSCSGRSATSACSSPTSSRPPPSSSSASIRSSRASWRSSSSLAASVWTNGSYAKSASGASRQSESAARRVAARAAGSSPARPREQLLEALQVELARPDPQHVPGGSGLEHVAGAPERLAQRGDVDLNRLRGGLRAPPPARAPQRAGRSRRPRSRGGAGTRTARAGAERRDRADVRRPAPRAAPEP